MKNYIIFWVSTFWVIQHIHQQPAGFGPFHHGLGDQEALCSLSSAGGIPAVPNLWPGWEVLGDRCHPLLQPRVLPSLGSTARLSPAPSLLHQDSPNRWHLCPPPPHFCCHLIALQWWLLAGLSPSPWHAAAAAAQVPVASRWPRHEGEKPQKTNCFPLAFLSFAKSPSAVI